MIEPLPHEMKCATCFEYEYDCDCVKSKAVKELVALMEDKAIENRNLIINIIDWIEEDLEENDVNFKTTRASVEAVFNLTKVNE